MMGLIFPISVGSRDVILVSANHVAGISFEDH